MLWYKCSFRGFSNPAKKNCSGETLRNCNFFSMKMDTFELLNCITKSYLQKVTHQTLIFKNTAWNLNLRSFAHVVNSGLAACEPCCEPESNHLLMTSASLKSEKNLNLPRNLKAPKLNKRCGIIPLHCSPAVREQ